MTNNSFPRRFDFLSWTEAAEAAQKQRSTLIWPFGACEQHGPHLPLNTDSFFSERIAQIVLERLPKAFPIWMLPPQSIGFSPEHCSFAGTISLPASLLLQLVMQVGSQVSSIGIKRLVLFNAHGGQIGLLEAAARELRMNCPELAVLPCFLWRGVDSLQELIPSLEIEVGLHAGLAETSLMLSLNSELVGPDRPSEGLHSSQASSIPPKGWSLEGDAPYSWLTQDLSKSGVIGDSTDANSSLGKKIEDALVDHWTNLLTGLMSSDWPSVS